MDYMVKIYDNGRMMLPASVRKKWKLKPGGEVILREREEGLLLTSPAAEVARLKVSIKKSLPKGVSLVDALFEERRRERDHDAAGH
jgi:AbrB family looped-hinge helix DNA binding protein